MTYFSSITIKNQLLEVSLGQLVQVSTLDTKLCSAPPSLSLGEFVFMVTESALNCLCRAQMLAFSYSRQASFQSGRGGQP